MAGPSWRDQGSEPDVRISLANERTFRAWIRTALALLAGGVALPQFVSAPRLPWLIVAIALLLVGAAAMLSVEAYRHWRSNEIAMRQGHPLPGTVALPALAGLGAALGLVVALLLLNR